nr:alpha-glucosidase/alpha-galactosidase [Lachnospiraceae bacterium]
NHFTWFDAASYKGVDLFPMYDKYIDAHFEEGISLDNENWMNSSFACAHRVKFDLFKKYGWIAAAGDRHLAEFMPGDTYLNDPETVKSWKFGLTSVQWRKDDLQKRLDRSKKLAAMEEEIELEPTGEEGILLIKALCGLTRVVSNVNIPNTAKQITNLPDTAVVETNAVFEKDHIHPIVAGALSDEVYDLVIPHVRIHELTMDAAMNCDEEKAVQAFLMDPNVKSKNPSETEVRALVHDMIANTLTYLPEGWKK